MRQEKDHASKLYFYQQKLFGVLPRNSETSFGAPAQAALPINGRPVNLCYVFFLAKVNKAKVQRKKNTREKSICSTMITPYGPRCTHGC